MRLYLFGLIALVSACSQPTTTSTSGGSARSSSTSLDSLPAGSIQIAVTQLDQLDRYGCKVYITAKNTADTGERTPFIQIDTEALNAEGQVLSTGKTGITNILPGRSVNREFLLNDVRCDEIVKFRGLSGETNAVATGPDTIIPIEQS
ncbi:hypothetical protein ASE75_13840 [Sphingomonas sp. Leaf17]|uniref:hypothetical protein n=1 Tax=Sphingomonas sp. Leaf17 TaxID=1735683 RepID=UPI0006F7FE04|nr:hypothetical protein [Sphingomonas sp. Leaf17]KQM62704.1 hypothetical protein ASE75_13840 [Sphingomonas sp. Leaf17]